MKKLILFCCALCCARAFCAPKSAGFVSPVESLDFYGSAAMNFPKNFSGAFWADSSYAFAYGAKARFAGMELRYFNSCGKTAGAELAAIKSEQDYRNVFNKSRYSLLLDLKKFDERFDAKIALGSLAAFSRMSSPALGTSLSPFASAVSDAAALSPSLPTKSSAKKDDAIFAGIALHSMEELSAESFRFLPLRFEFFLSKNECDYSLKPFMVTARGGFLYKNFLKITSGVWFGRYYSQKEEPPQISWWQKFPARNSSLYNSFMLENTVAIPYFKNKLIFGITENSQSFGRFWIRDEAFFKAGGMSVAASAFISDNVFLQKEIPLVAMGGSKKYSLWQIKLIPEYRLQLKKGECIKFGGGGFLESKITNYEKESQFASLDAKFATGIKYLGKVQSASITGAVSNIEIRQHLKAEEKMHLPKVSVAASFSQRFKNNHRLSINAAAGIQLHGEPSKKEWSESLRVYYYPGKGVLKSVSLGATTSQKNSVCKIAPYAKASFLFKLKKVRINADICVNSNFEFSE